MYTPKAITKRKTWKAILCGLFIGVLSLLSSHSSLAQFYNGTQMTFGKNRIQYKEFLWTYYKMDEFDVYFYLNGTELADFTAKYASEQLPIMERRLETNLGDKIQFIIFNNLSDLKQSNIGLSGNQRYNTGGITKIIGSKVFIYFDGNIRNFERQIRAGIAEVLVNQIFYGSSIGSQIKNTTLFTLPDWYKNGLLSYLSEDWNTEIDSRVRDGILSGRFDKFNHLTGEEALYAGHALWKYVAEQFGSSSITDIVAMSQISRSVENGFLYVVGVSFKNLNQNYLEYWRQIYQEEEEGRVTPETQDLKRVRKQRVYNRYKLSPDGTKSVYVDYDDGKFKLRLKDLTTGKKKTLLRGGFRLEEKVDYSYPLISWHPSSRILAMIVERRGEIYLYFYNLAERSYQRVIMYSFEKVVDFSYSPDGRSFIMSAVQKGQSDLYTYNIAAGSHQQLTNDVYDDLDPVFFGKDKILFSSNRPNDTLIWDPDEIITDLPKSTDLFILQRNNRRVPLLQITQTPYANEIQPKVISEGYFMFLSDDNGINNRYAGSFDSTISHVDTSIHYRYFTKTYPVTNYSRNILQHDANPGSDYLTQVIFNNGKYYLQREEVLPPSMLSPLSLSETTQRTQLEVKSKELEKNKQLADMKAQIGPFSRQFKNVYYTAEQLIPEEKESDEIDIDNYVFDRQAFLTLHPQDSTRRTTSSVVKPEEKGFKIPKRLNYRTEYSINETTTQLDFTSLNFFYQPFDGIGSGFNNLGLNGFFQVSMNDLLENHRITAGFRIPLNLNNIEYIFSYANMEKRLDKEIVFVRQATEARYINIYYPSIEFIQRFRSYQVYYILTYPFSPVIAVRGTANVRYQKFTWLSTNEPALREPDLNEYWGGLKGEVIYDDTKELGLNLYKGTRFKIFGEYTQVIGPEDKSMVVTGLDIRNYLPIHRTFIWANRLAASTSFGKNRLIYYLGGVDNWLAPKSESNTPIDYTMNYAYQALATNMRGFHQNARNGNNFVVINSELRFPVFRYFYNRPIRSDFINNFQLVGFGDVGLAWAGPDPYSEENSFYIRIIEDGSLRIKVREQKEPLIGGFGFGARTRLLGYFLRADLAWGVEDRVIKKPVFYLSLSLDF